MIPLKADSPIVSCLVKGDIMGMVPLDKLKQQWGQDMTSEHAIGQIIQHLEALSTLVQERGRSLKSLDGAVKELTKRLDALHNRMMLLERQWEEARRTVNDESRGGEQETETTSSPTERKTRGGKRKPKGEQ